MPKKNDPNTKFPGKKKKSIQSGGVDFTIEMVSLDMLKPHPRNYLEHPDDEVEHIAQSIRDNGVYKNIVVARDDTILAGHGVVKALRKMGVARAPARRLDLTSDDPRALKVLAGDNEISHLREVDDRALSEMLREIKDSCPDGLLGTGYDEMMLANLVFVTRPMSEVQDFDAAAAWVGMPEYEVTPRPLNLMVNFRNKGDKEKFIKLLGVSVTDAMKSIWWPLREKEDPSSLKFKG